MIRLKELRQEKELSQKEIALELQVPLRTYQRWENGESQIKPDKAQALADYFGVSVGYLLGYENEFNDLIDKLGDLQGYDELNKLKLKLKIQSSLLEHILNKEGGNFPESVAKLEKLIDDKFKKDELDNAEKILFIEIIANLRSVSESLQELHYNLQIFSN